MHARQNLFASKLFGDDIKKILPIIEPNGSDSAMFDNVFELLVMGGRSLPHAMMMMIPEAWEGNAAMDDERKSFYRYASSLVEPWDGPAAIVFSDGQLVGATLDRNGLRPARWLVTTDDRVILMRESRTGHERKPEHVEDIAHKLGVPEEEVVNMNRRLSSPDSSLNAPLGGESESEWQDWLADDTPDQESRLADSDELQERQTLLSAALDELTERERDILHARRLRDEPVTLEDLSVKYGISRERVRQIEVRAFEKLQQKMKAALVRARAETLDARKPLS
jgi:DNA-directed RNA polymerase specialized sigma24 family protein